MPHLFVPPRVKQELLEERRQFEQCILNACTTDPVCEQWNKELQRLDPRLRLVKAPEYLVIGMPLEPGYYHLVRDNETTFPTVTPVRGEHGEYREPDSRLLEQLKGMDLWNANVIAAHKLQQETERRQAEQDKHRTRDARQGDILERWHAVSRTQVSMNRETAWSQNQAGQRAAKANARGRRPSEGT